MVNQCSFKFKYFSMHYPCFFNICKIFIDCQLVLIIFPSLSQNMQHAPLEEGMLCFGSQSMVSQLQGKTGLQRGTAKEKVLKLWQPESRERPEDPGTRIPPFRSHSSNPPQPGPSSSATIQPPTHQWMKSLMGIVLPQSKYLPNTLVLRGTFQI